MRTNVQTRRSFYKREARRGLRSNLGLLSAAIIALSVEVGISSLFEKILCLLDFTFARLDPMASEAFILLGELASSSISLPILLGIFRAATMIAEGKRADCADCMYYLSDGEKYSDFIGKTASVMLKLLPIFILISAVCRHTDGIMRYVFILFTIILGMTALTATGLRSAYDCLRMVISFLPHIALTVITGGGALAVLLPYIALALANYRYYSSEIDTARRSKINEINIKKPHGRHCREVKETT